MTEQKFQQLVDIMATLRSPGGCPWDVEQTHESLSRHVLEEVYEVIESIDEGKLDELPGELGDLLLIRLWYSGIRVLVSKTPIVRKKIQPTVEWALDLNLDHTYPFSIRPPACAGIFIF